MFSMEQHLLIRNSSRTMTSYPHMSILHRTRRFLLCLGLTVGLASGAQAYDIEFDVSPKHVELGKPVQVTFRFHGIDNPPQPALSGVDGFQVLGNPRQEFRTMSAGGRTQRTVSWTYHLAPTRIGKLTIGPLNYTARGETKVLPQVTVSVVEPSTKQELFAEITSPTKEVYLHQTFDVVLSIYSRNVDLGGDFRLSNMPDSRISFQQFHQETAEPEVRNKQLYTVKRFQSEARALASGTFTIAPTVGVAVQTEKRRKRRSAFDFFLGGPQVEYVQVTPNALDITVKPLPQEGRPDSFSGAVGKFDFDVSAQPLEVSAGDPINVTMRIQGRGNIDTVSSPSTDLGDAFRVYDAQLVDKQLNDRRDRGAKVFEQVIIPRSDEVTEIPPFAFSYFDPEADSYRTIEQGPFPIQVAASAAASDVLQLQREREAAELQVLEEDIVYLKPAPDDWYKVERKAWYTGPAFLAAQLVPLLGCLIAWFGAKRRDDLSQDVARARRLQAPKAARAALAQARAALDQDDTGAFHEAVWEALSSYFGNRFNLSPGMISRQLVLAQLDGSSLPDADRKALGDLFEQCEMARFGFSGQGEDLHDRAGMEATLSELDRLLKVCDKMKGAG